MMYVLYGCYSFVFLFIMKCNIDQVIHFISHLQHFCAMLIEKSHVWFSLYFSFKIDQLTNDHFPKFYGMLMRNPMPVVLLPRRQQSAQNRQTGHRNPDLQWKIMNRVEPDSRQCQIIRPDIR